MPLDSRADKTALVGWHWVDPKTDRAPRLYGKPHAVINYTPGERANSANGTTTHHHWAFVFHVGYDNFIIHEVVIPNAVLLVPGIECRIPLNGVVIIQPYASHLNRGEPARSLGGRPFPDPIVRPKAVSYTHLTLPTICSV